jgi:hypothetical protein
VAKSQDVLARFVLPIYTKANEAMEAVAALKVNTHQTYEVEACQDPTCQR